ncbi:uncharacterized protein CDAR_303021 [Caerostris darwini]|uniref:Lysosome-associated membrane glycoprotein 5 n=1 Tax=Caerostris darwini TaxID=1538125 RepID=A0AAV4V533_9ARAC|nr:uncharacterized protein CDAR_303021 [Caerostris darwini]
MIFQQDGIPPHWNSDIPRFLDKIIFTAMDRKRCIYCLITAISSHNSSVLLPVMLCQRYGLCVSRHLVGFNSCYPCLQKVSVRFETSKMGFIRKVVFTLVLFVAIGYGVSDDLELDTTTVLLDTTTKDLTTSTSNPDTTSDTTTTSTTITTTPLPKTTTTTTTLPPVTTVAPKPSPEKGLWNVTDGNVTCIRAELQIQFTVNIGNEQVFVLSPNASDSKSSCKISNVTQELVLSDTNYDLAFLFEKDSTKTFVRNVTLLYRTSEGQELFYNDTKLFTVKSGNSYQCRSTDTVKMGNASMEILHIHIQAFGTADEDGFNTAEECEADDTISDIIPIAVACALASLIIIVLIAYLVGRRRRNQKGYTSV